MKKSKLWTVVIPIILGIVILGIPIMVVLSRMGVFTPAPTAEVVMTAPENAKELVFVADYDFDPYSYLNEDGTPNGMDVEIAYELANRLGMRPRIEFGTWSECKEKIKNKEADVLLGLEIFVDGTSTGTLKSIPVGTDTLSIIGKDSIDDAAALSKKRVGVTFGSALMGLFKLNCEYVEYFTYSEMLEALDKGEIDYAICHASVAIRIIEKNHYDFKPSLVLMESFPTMGIRQDEPELQGSINNTLKDMSADGTINALREKWIVSNVQNRTVSEVFNNYQEFFILYIVLSVVIIAGYVIAVISIRSSVFRKKALEIVQEERKNVQDALDREIIRTRDEKAYQLAILSRAYSYSRINLTKNSIIPPIIERENGQPVDYTDKFPSPLPTYEEVFSIGASRYVDDEYKESYKAYHNCDFLIKCFNEGNFMPEYVCRIYSTKLGWHYRKYVTYLSKADDSDEIFGMSVAYDITQEYEAAEREKQYKERLEEANRSKTDFLFSMSHDIRTPMNAILGYTDIALNHIGEQDRVNDSLKKIKISGGHLLSLINDILEMSRIEAGKLEIVNRPVDVYAVTESVTIMSQALAISKDITFTTKIGELKNPYVYADELHVNQVIINLISNAVKYTNPGGAVEYTIDQIGDPIGNAARYRFTVKDNGIGMSDEFQKHLFESFSREQTSTVSKQEGAGLGLAIVKNIVDIIGGTISVKSTKDVGSIFTLEIPAQIMDDEAIRQYKEENKSSADKTEGFSLAGKKALLVEDNEMNREIAMDMLKETGLAIDIAEDGAIAVDKVKEMGTDYYDFILMDIQMPVMNGYEATAEIRKLEGGGKVPIIALSANAFKEDMEKSTEAGMDGHVAKPIDVKELIEVISKHL